MNCTAFKYVISHILEFRRGRYLTIVLPIPAESRDAAYQVLVFDGTSEVYAQQEHDLLDAIRAANAYLDWKMDHNADGSIQAATSAQAA